MYRSMIVVFLIASTISLADDVLVVCPKPFRSAMKEWAQYREDQGYNVRWLDTAKTDKDLRKKIHNAVKPGTQTAVLLVGDADPAEVGSKQSVPTHYIPAKVNIHWGPEKEIASDNYYADLDDDELPDLALGRWPVDRAEEIEAITHKVIHYETESTYGEWRRRISFVACPGDFGGVIDTLLEQASRRLTTAGIPASFATTATYGSWRSPYCPDPRRFAEMTLNRLNEGSLFWIYIGHGHCRVVDRVKTPDNQRFPILRIEDTPTLQCQSGHPIAIFLACYTGQFDAKQDSLSEEMLRSAGGPVAIYSSTRVTMPYAMTVMGTEMMNAYFTERAETLGDLIVAAKRRMVEAPRTDSSSKSVDTLALMMNPLSQDLKAERLEHVHMFHLLGDPLLKLPHPSDVLIEAIDTVHPGERMVIRATTPVGGRCQIELVPPRDRLPFRPAARVKFAPTEEQFADLQTTYERANAPALASQTLDVPAGTFESSLEVPDSLQGIGHVRIFVTGDGGYALGHEELTIAPVPTSK